MILAQMKQSSHQFLINSVRDSKSGYKTHTYISRGLP